MSSHNIIRACSLCLLIIFCQVSYAKTTSSLYAEIGADNNSGRNYYISGRHDFSNRIELHAGGGNSTSNDSTGAQVSSSSYSFGIKSDLAATYDMGLDRRHAQQTDNLDIDSTTLTLELNTLNWNAYISPESRDVSLVSSTLNRTVAFSSNGYVAGVGYYGWGPVYITFSHAAHTYPSRISRIGARPRLSNYIFGSDTVNQLFDLETRHNTIELGYLFTSTSLSFIHSKGQSAVDQSIATTNKIYFSWEISPTWLVNATLGKSQVNTSSSKTTFGSLGLTSKW